MRQILDESVADGIAQTKHSRRGECKKPMQKGFGLQEKNLNKSDFFYFYNSSNSISLSVSGFKVT
ncbi:MAG: hypothetical protein CL915_15285, partial [Deltaproteobacteria bacterium]|nr:hypothetical protein [Deltaproteobacteria bacterium]